MSNSVFWENKKNVFNLWSAELAQKAVKVNLYYWVILSTEIIVKFRWGKYFLISPGRWILLLLARTALLCHFNVYHSISFREIRKLQTFLSWKIPSCVPILPSTFRTFGLIQQMTNCWYFSYFSQKIWFDTSCKLFP